MKKHILILILFLNSSIFCENFAQKKTNEINWYSLEEAESLQKTKPRVIMIDFYTDWCGWCKKLDKLTYKNDSIIKYINSNFYPVKFNAEEKDSVKYLGKVYGSKKRGKKFLNDFAVKLLDGKLSYPSIIYLDENFKKIGVHGYTESKDLFIILTYFAEKIYKNTSFEEYKKFYIKTKKSFKNSFSLIKWTEIEEFEKENDEKPKKILIHLYASWMQSSQIMTETTFNDPSIAKYLNEKFYCVHFNVFSKDSLFIFNRTFKNDTIKHPFHDFAIAILEGKMTFPAVIVMDENKKLINRLQAYLTPEKAESIFKYFGDNKYKSVKWEEYSKNFKSEFFKKEKIDNEK